MHLSMFTMNMGSGGDYPRSMGVDAEFQQYLTFNMVQVGIRGFDDEN